MVFQGEVPWHGLGTPITDAHTFEEGFQLAGLDWEVKTRHLFTSDGEQVTHRAAYRESDGRILGIVGPRWEPLQNREAFDIFEPLVESGELKLHTAGSLRNGERIWVLLQMATDPTPIVKGDEICHFVLLSNGHDGKLAVRLGFTPIRVVCANTEALARSSTASKLIRVRHNKFVRENCEKLRDIMNLANQEFEATTEQYKFLASKSINKKDLEKYIKIVMGLHDKKDDDISTRSKNLMNRIEWYFDNGKGNKLPGVEGTYWAAYNAVTEYLNHEQGRNNNNRMDSVWFGVNANMASKAFDTALALAS
jgi:phage/plasmid-like protein (TIGR03299 family)